MKKRVAFYQPFMNERGTCVAMYDYAHYNKILLNNESVFIYDSLDSRNETTGLNRIKQAFDIFDVECANYNNDDPRNRTSKIDKILQDQNIDYIYMCKSGYNDAVIPTKAKVLVHVVGMVDPSHKHGDVWAYVSKFSSAACSQNTLPYVPYMVSLPNIEDDIRAELNIPSDMVVIGRYGGMDTFDPWAWPVIWEVLSKRKNIFFLFLNTPKAFDHERVLHLPATSDIIYKTKFINSCDAMLHVRGNGETFGAACAEFSTRNKPIITDIRSPERNHIDILQNRGIYFNSPQSLYEILMNFKPNPNLNWNCYDDYTPENVMKIFDKEFLI